MMRAVVLYGPQDLRITDFPMPSPDEYEVRIKVAYCGICGTDLHKYAGQSGARPVTYPVPLGHEISGVVDAVGSQVRNIRPGDRVTADPNWSCGKCWHCRNGMRHLCTDSRGVVKGMAEYVCAPEENVYPIPPDLTLRDAALTEPLSCCIRGVEMLDVKLGQTVVIVGFGAIGQMMLQLLKHSSGGCIAVVEPMVEKRALAMEMGASLFIDPNTEDIQAKLAEYGVTCVERVIECVGTSETAQMAMKIAGRGATVVLFGVARKDAAVMLNQYDAFWKELTIKTSYINPNTTQRALNLLRERVVDADRIISQVIGMEDAVEEIRTRQYGRFGKVLIRISTDEE